MNPPKPRLLFLLSKEETALEEWLTVAPANRYNVFVKRDDGCIPECIISSKPGLVLLHHNTRAPHRWEQLTLELRRFDPTMPLVLLTSNGSEELATRALRLGFRDYLVLPTSRESLEEAVNRCLSCSRDCASPQNYRLEDSAEGMIGAHPSLCQIKLFMMKAAKSDSTILITGETGTGKELAAEFIHNNSARKGKPFICINCAAIPDTLLESELFGHASGAFTGAATSHDGLFAEADGGTVFLDEVGDMSLLGQAKILRVLDKRVIHSLGKTKSRQLNVRFIAATNQDIESMAGCGTFRKDLLFRLNVARVELPPLRERKNDIPILLHHYCKKFSSMAACPVPQFSEECLHHLLHYDWPGNVRELRNVLESVFAIQAPLEIRLEHLPARLQKTLIANKDLPSTDRDQLIAALAATQWNKSKCAEKLSWSRMTLYRKMAKYDISTSFKGPAASPSAELKGRAA